MRVVRVSLVVTFFPDSESSITLITLLDTHLLWYDYDSFFFRLAVS